MNLRYYEIFVRVYERMNMSVVAEEMFLSQPAISRIIRELENHYDLRFFIRQSGRLYRTAGGERFYQYAKELISCEEQLRQALADQKKRRKITLGASPTAVGYYLPTILQAYNQECGELDVHLYSGAPGSLENRLLDARMDLAIVEGRVRSWELTSVPLFRDDIVLVSGQPLKTPVADKPLRLMTRDAGDDARRQFEQAFHDAGIEYTIQGEFTDIEGLKRCAACGLGIGLVPRQTILPEDKLYELAIPGMSLQAEFSLVHHRSKFFFPQLKTLIAFLTDSLTSITAMQ